MKRSTKLTEKEFFKKYDKTPNCPQEEKSGKTTMRHHFYLDWQYSESLRTHATDKPGP